MCCEFWVYGGFHTKCKNYSINAQNIWLCWLKSLTFVTPPRVWRLGYLIYISAQFHHVFSEKFYFNRCTDNEDEPWKCIIFSCKVRNPKKCLCLEYILKFFLYMSTWEKFHLVSSATRYIILYLSRKYASSCEIQRRF